MEYFAMFSPHFMESGRNGLWQCQADGPESEPLRLKGENSEKRK
jgi:hypothetical protein